MLPSWSEAKKEAFLSFDGGFNIYEPLCFDHWTDENGEPTYEGYSGADEWGNRCFGPADEDCPICGVGNDDYLGEWDAT